MQLADDSIGVRPVARTDAVGDALTFERRQRRHRDAGVFDRFGEVEAQHRAVDALVDHDLLAVAADVELMLGVPPGAPEEPAGDDHQQDDDKSRTAPAPSGRLIVSGAMSCRPSVDP